MHFSSNLLLLALTSLAAAQSCTVVTYKVVKGDTLSTIAAAKGVSVEQILDVNDIEDQDVIAVDQIIGIPSATCVPESATAKCPGVSTYVVVSGDWLSKIAAAHGVTTEQIVAANPQIVNVDLIKPKDVIAIPSPDCVVASKTRREAAANSPLPPASCVSSGPATYTIVEGDGLYSVAVNKLNISYPSLLAANPDIPNANNVTVGQVINVPQCSAATPRATGTASSTETCVPSAVATYVIKSGDTLYQIAEANNATLSAVKAVNSQIANFDAIAVGDVINLPSCSPEEAAVAVEETTYTCAASGNETYTVQSGDNLSAIAASIPITLEALEAANPAITNPDLIFAGQVLNITLCEDCTTSGDAAYTIVSGDTLTDIAASREVSLTGLLAVNPAITNPDLIYPGQNVTIPICGSSATTPAVTCSSTSNGTYVVKSGDTFSAIAIAQGITVEALSKANPEVTNIDAIAVDQLLRVPVCGAATATATSSSSVVTVTACPVKKSVAKQQKKLQATIEKQKKKAAKEAKKEAKKAKKESRTHARAFNA